jgi:hypothetical protein
MHWIVLAIALPAAFAVAARSQDVERVRVADAGAPLTQGVPRDVFLTLASPPDYERGSGTETAGTWLGPEYGTTKPAGRTSIAWRLSFRESKQIPSAAAAEQVTRGWPVDLKGGVSVDHVIGARIVGTMFGAYVLTRAPGSSSAAYEGALAFPIAPRLFALLHLDVLDPPSDAGRDGTYVVEGIPASIWNRGQALRALTGVRVEGSLAPTRVSRTVSNRGRVIRGLVADAFRHPVVRALVGLERLVGSSWQTVAKTRTNRRGAYTVRGIAKRARYRVVAVLDGNSARSVAVVAGRR